MQFTQLALDDETRAFWREVNEFIAANRDPALATEPDVNANDQRLQRALGRRGWNIPHWPKELGGAALSPLQRHILALELSRSGAPLVGRGLTHLILPAVEQFGSQELKAEIFPGVARGDINFCLGYTEPDGGSDMAAARTRAIRDGDEWIIRGAKMFTTTAHLADFSFLIARSDTAAPKHKGLTMFLMPLKVPGVEIRPIQTIADERTNLVFYSDARISDRYRLGAEGDGWNVVSGPLGQEHGHAHGDPERLSEICGQGAGYVADLREVVAEAVDWAKCNGRAADPQVRLRVAQAALEMEAYRNTPGAMGRLAVEGLTRAASDFIDLMGPAGVLAKDTEGHVGHGVIEWSHRHAVGGSTYGGTTEVFRNMVAQRILGLPRPPKPAGASS
jgi:alkylation response protein AidB-like acyl-CoA dehydrogenase